MNDMWNKGVYVGPDCFVGFQMLCVILEESNSVDDVITISINPIGLISKVNGNRSINSGRIAAKRLKILLSQANLSQDGGKLSVRGIEYIVSFSKFLVWWSYKVVRC